MTRFSDSNELQENVTLPGQSSPDRGSTVDVILGCPNKQKDMPESQERIYSHQYKTACLKNI